MDLVTLTEEILNGKLHFLCSVAALILWFLLQLKVSLVTQKVSYKITTKNNKSRLVKTLRDYNVMFYYRVANYKSNRKETLPSPGFFDTSQ